ncbi:uncharacterized protein DC041_0012877 [Schistosoma bovis]|uniref:Uncharacterized protein n=1 Tax=Schistosoma bovis TaxID=6184 RepID=A0A430QN64_SCHBO|nr:uncharacterized protein DC041_0012877 [Schistosoma bovis]
MATFSQLVEMRLTIEAYTCWLNDHVQGYMYFPMLIFLFEFVLFLHVKHPFIQQNARPVITLIPLILLAREQARSVTES